MDASGASSSANPIPTWPRLTVDGERLPSPTPPPAHLAGRQSAATIPWTVEDIYDDFCGRLSALVRALTLDQEMLYGLLCEPDKELMCLYGYADGRWDLTLPEQMLPPGLPEPALGINHCPGHTSRNEYLSFVARHADSWLIGVAFFLATHLNANQRGRLFDMMNELPNVHDRFYHCYGTLWLSTNAPPSPDYVYNQNNYSSTLGQESGLVSTGLIENVSNPNVEAITPSVENMSPSQELVQNVSDPDKDSKKPAEEKDIDYDARYFCGACGAPYHANAFWICCDICEQWFHGKCVKVTASQSKHLKDYKCPDCIREDTGE